MYIKTAITVKYKSMPCHVSSKNTNMKPQKMTNRFLRKLKRLRNQLVPIVHNTIFLKTH